MDEIWHSAEFVRVRGALLSEDRFFIVPVASTVKEAGATADEALIGIRPFDNFYVSRGCIHNLDSSIALLTR